MVPEYDGRQQYSPPLNSAVCCAHLLIILIQQVTPAWFGTWCGDFVMVNGKYSDKLTEAEIMRKIYQSEYVIALDELPDFK